MASVSALDLDVRQSLEHTRQTDIGTSKPYPLDKDELLDHWPRWIWAAARTKPAPPVDDAFGRR